MARRTTDLVTLAALLTLVACSTDEQELVTCEDLAPAAEVSFAQIAARITEPGAKSCAGCHNSRTPVYGVNLETPALAYDTLVTRFPTIYLQLATGEMPYVGEAWSDEELTELRSWYCRGGFYEP